MTKPSKKNLKKTSTGFQRRPRVADLMTPELHSFVTSSQAEERAGDAAMALEYHRGIPMFTRSRHAVLLEQLAGLKDEMTPWLWARWAAYQCTRAEDPGTPSMDTLRFALAYVVQAFHGDDLDEMYDNGGDPVSLTARVMGESWAYQQLCTYELGGLATFLSDLATGRLADEAGLAWQWVNARMGGYRIESREPMKLEVRDLSTDRVSSVLDLGAGIHPDDGEWVMGRLVPSGEGQMFDTRPLSVDEQTAREAAEATYSRGEWVEVLADGIDDGRLDRAVLMREDLELVTDVSSLRLLEVGTEPRNLAHALEAERNGRDEVGRAAFRLLRWVSEGKVEDQQAPCVAAALLNPHAVTEAKRHGLGGEAFAKWAELVPEPGRSRLRRLGEGAGARAA